MRKTTYRYDPSRRTVLKFSAAAAAAGVVALKAPSVFAQDRSIKVGTYGGYFEESFRKHIFPEFTKATGITVESVPEPTGEAWLVQLEQAAKAGVAPADVNMIAQVPMIRGIRGDLWQRLDMAKMPNAAKVFEDYLNTYPDGGVAGVPAVAWFITLVTNTETYADAPQSWKFFWDGAGKNSLGLLALASNSFMLDIAAKTYFPGQDVLKSEDGIQKVLDKIAELKPNVALWYRDEGQFQNALQTGEIPAGQYYHDVTGLAAADGFPVRSTFPQEGGVADRGSWAVTKACKKVEEAQVFIDYMCQPAVQATLARKVGTAPVIPRDLMDLSAEEFAAVSSDTAPIIPDYTLYTDKGDWVNERWTAMITG
ncbi:ABC transporter substrate-binding protein [Caenispirillum bisanense]|uniref:Putative spermidine/putrescine transport system substrate-binding protein n=1 Tax=Caenispirillum bisanense TaxID=414052 RepID=A0A286GQM2_9PROT|nr:extracellular solute-binding protein [Caenispirillum bisanense]SOD97845.1 putative spermidine/putrescine transport system substrate-binding protein [Caenispirillum bisanense]